MDAHQVRSSTIETDILSERHQEAYPKECQTPCRHRRYIGEYTREESEVDISLLYIPLIQICSSKERTVMPMYEWEDDDF